MMKTTYTALDISDATGIKKRQVLQRAEIENWACSFETVKGGKAKRFSLDALPEDIKIKLVSQQNDLLPVPSVNNKVSVIEPNKIVSLESDSTKRALAKADLLRLYQRHMESAPWGKKSEHRDSFMLAYNSGIAYPELYRLIGASSWKTIEGWKRQLQDTGDSFSLVDRRGAWKRGEMSFSPDQKKIILRCALHPNKPLISEIVRMARSIMAARGIGDGGLSEATFRRFITEWKSKHYDVWVWHREGSKAWNDKVASYIERDYDLINVGDILVADGHVLNFEIINPWTGKPKRIMMVLWYDMKSSFPLGWEIMPTENIASIHAALRRAIMRLGKIPKVAYLDNGRAFRAKFFEGCPDFDEAGIAGMYERLGIKTIHAWPYHGQSKTVERFFGTFAELERMSPTYTGTSIETKPPRMMRGERIHRKIYEATSPSVSLWEAHRAIASWFDLYAERPKKSGHLKGIAPVDVFSDGMGTGVDPAELRFLMMAQEIKTIRRNGINLPWGKYDAPQLYGRRHPVNVLYDFQDRSSVIICEPDGSILCEAYPVEKQHPAASVLGTDEDRERLSAAIEAKRRQEKMTNVGAREFLEREVMPEHRRHMESLGFDPSSRAIEAGPRAIAAPCQLTDDQCREIEAAAAKMEVIDLAQEIEIRASEVIREDEFSGLDGLSEMDRYEKLVELSARGEIPERQAAWMHYYELTAEYLSQREYWEEYRVKMSLMYQRR